MAFPTAPMLAEAAQKTAAAHNIDILDIKIKKAGPHTAVTLIVESLGDLNPDLDTLEIISKDISQSFDDAETAGTLTFGSQSYNLEVTTPGIDHPLTKPRHWRRNRGRLVHLVTPETPDQPAQDFLARIGDVSKDETRVILIGRKNLGAKKPAWRDPSAEPATETFVITGDEKDSYTAVVEIEFSAAPEKETHLAAADFDAVAH